MAGFHPEPPVEQQPQDQSITNRAQEATAAPPAPAPKAPPIDRNSIEEKLSGALHVMLNHARRRSPDKDFDAVWNSTRARFPQLFEAIKSLDPIKLKTVLDLAQRAEPAFRGIVANRSGSQEEEPQQGSLLQQFEHKITKYIFANRWSHCPSNRMLGFLEVRDAAPSEFLAACLCAAYGQKDF